jgi:hypothetical protein
MYHDYDFMIIISGTNKKWTEFLSLEEKSTVHRESMNDVTISASRYFHCRTL